MIISFLSQKGGVTKSTLARATATAFVNGGWACHIADLDWQQQTSMKWSTRRSETKALVEVSVHKRIEPALKNESLYDVLLVDGRAASDRDAIIVAAKSNLVVLPTSTTVDDLEPQLNFANDLRNNGVDANKLLFIINKAGSMLEVQNTINSIRGWGFNVSENPIEYKTAYAKAQDVGLSLIETKFKTLSLSAEKAVQDIINKISGGN
ncbi:MAG: ParA family protein [Aliivibrio sp.]|nr:ParA family protein [Aliivibrio sp.]